MDHQQPQQQFQPQQGPFWPSSSSGGYPHQQHHPHFPPHQQDFSHHLPPPPPPPQQQQQQQWGHPDNHLQQQQQQPPQPPMVMPSLQPHPPVPYHNHPPIPPYPPSVHNYPPPPRPHHMLPHPPPSAFPPPTQAWGNPSWAQNQGWEYTERNIVYNNEEDWAARARAWADAKSGTENNHMQSQFMAVGRVAEHSYDYHDQYQQAVLPPFTGTQQSSVPQTSNQLLADSMMDRQKQVNHLREPTSFGSGTSSLYGTDELTCYDSRVEDLATDTIRMASPQRSFGPSSSVYEQEVPYSYSSTPAGYREAMRQNESLHVPLPLPLPSVEGLHHPQSTLPSREISAEHHFIHGEQSVKILADASDQPLDFEPRSASDHDPHQMIRYGHADPAGSLGGMGHEASGTSIHAWTQAAPGAVFSQIPPVSSGIQFDPSFISQSSLPVHTAPVFGRIPGPSFQPNIPPVSAPFGLGIGASLHSAAGFPGDANGAFNFSERPKKVAVPNWLREEIIKNKAVIANTVPTHPTGDSFHSIGSEEVDRFSRKADQADSKSIDSTTRSTDDEEDDEDDMEAARSAAINQEIKRVLTEVLLKVTDDLLDEIATKVLIEDDLTVEVDERRVHENHSVSPSLPVVSTPKASVKVLVPVIENANVVDGVGESSSPSSTGGDILGLANYASDDDADETQNSKVLLSGTIIGASHQQESDDKPSENVPKAVEKGTALADIEEPSVGSCDMESDKNRTDHTGAFQNQNTKSNDLYMMKSASPTAENVYAHQKTPRGVSGIGELLSVDSGKVNGFSLENANALGPKGSLDGKQGRKPESTCGNANSAKSTTGEFPAKEAGSMSGSSRHPENRATISKVLGKEVKPGTGKKGRQHSDAGDTRFSEDKDKKERMDKRENLKERARDVSVKQVVNVRESEFRSGSKHDSIKDDRKDTAKDKRGRAKEDGERKKEQIRDEKEDCRTRVNNDSIRYSSRRPSSPSSRSRNIKDYSLVRHDSVSSDEPPENSKKRKLQSNKHSLSPSPTRSRGRQVLRSPNSKHSQRRHSPYSSHETRRRRSRSRTPVNQRRSAHKHKV